MKKIVIASIIINLVCFTVDSFAQNIITAKSEHETSVTPKGNTLVVKKKKNSDNAKVNERLMPGNTDKYRKDNAVPEDFPKYKNTGNLKPDADEYYQAKQKWIKTHPDEFKKIKHLTL